MSDSGYTWRPYHYELSFGVNLEFCVLFALSAIYISALMVLLARKGKHIPKPTRKRYVNMMIPFLVGFLLETVGYIGRLINHNDNTALGPYILQSITILIAPAFMAATLYMVFGEIVKAFDGYKYCYIPIRWFTKIFVIGDVMSILLQAAGGGVQGIGTLDLYNIGNKMIIAGLWVQIFFYGSFILTSSLFFLRFYKAPKNNYVEEKWFNRRSWKFMLGGVYATSILILIRSIYRVIEYLQGEGGKLLSEEMYLFVLDSTMVFFAGCVFLAIDLGRNLTMVVLNKENRDEHGMDMSLIK